MSKHRPFYGAQIHFQGHVFAAAAVCKFAGKEALHPALTVSAKIKANGCTVHAPIAA